MESGKPLQSSHLRTGSSPLSPGLFIHCRPTREPASDLWSTWAGALAAGRETFGWIQGSAALLALDAAPDGPFAWHAQRFDAPRAGSPWGDWPVSLRRRPAAVAIWEGDRVDAFAQGPFAGWPSAPALAGATVAPGSPCEDRAQWMQRVATAEAACRAGDLRKVVLARATRYAGPICPVATARALRAAHPEATVFFMSQGDAVFLGATPETLLRCTGRTLHTHALAGTRRRGATPAEDAALADDLRGSHKDRREHALVVADLAEHLAPFCDRLDWSPTPRVRRLSSVQHLETPFTGRLRPGVDPGAVARALHPTAALGGLPRAAARDWLSHTEPLDRGVYGAPVGWSDGHRAHFAVAIRSALIRPDAAWTFGGAGIVAGSDPAAEWRETALKQAVVADALRRPA